MEDHECVQVDRLTRMEDDIKKIEVLLEGNGRDGMRQDVMRLQFCYKGIKSTLDIQKRIGLAIVTGVVLNLGGLIFGLLTR